MAFLLPPLARTQLEMSNITHIGELIPDRRNPRAHTARNIGMIVDSLHEVGAARSIVIDELGNILAGNGTIEAAAEAGIERLQVVDADGETIIAVRRTGLTDAQKRRLSLMDNRTAELATWDADVLRELQGDGLKLDDLWREEEWQAILTTDNRDFQVGEKDDVIESDEWRISVTGPTTELKAITDFLDGYKRRGVVWNRSGSL